MNNTNIIVATQDWLDADNPPSIIGIVASVEALHKKHPDTPILLVIDASTALHDLSLPRFRPGLEKLMLAFERGPNPHGIEHAIDSSDESVLADTELLQCLQILQMNLTIKQVMPEPLYTQVKVQFVRSKITKQKGLWIPISPNTFLFFDAIQQRMRSANEVTSLTSELEGAEVDWRGYWPGNSEEKRASNADKAFHEVRNRLRHNMRALIDEQIEYFESTPEIIDHKVAIEKISEHTTGNVYMFVGAPASFPAAVLGGIDPKRVQLVVADALTLNSKDNLVGQPWNEYLDQDAMRSMTESIQSKQIPAVFTPTQLFKPTSDYQPFLSVALAEQIASLILPALEAGSGLHILAFQKLWNQFKGGAGQPIFDVLGAYILHEYILYGKHDDTIRLISVNVNVDSKDDSTNLEVCTSNFNQPIKIPILSENPFIDPAGLIRFYERCYGLENNTLCPASKATSDCLHLASCP